VAIDDSQLPRLRRSGPPVPALALPIVAVLLGVDCLFFDWIDNTPGREAYNFVAAIGIWAVASAVAGFVAAARDGDLVLRRLEGFAGLAGAAIALPYLVWRLVLPAAATGVRGTDVSAALGGATGVGLDRSIAFVAAPILAAAWLALARARLRESDMPDRLWFPLERINWFRVRGPARWAMIGGALTGLGCLLPWVSAGGVGFTGAGYDDLAALLAAGSWVVALTAWGWPDTERGLGAQGLFSVLFGAGVVLLVATTAARPSSFTPGVRGADPSWGLPVAAAGGLVLLWAGIRLLRSRL
jgi:hypothetical protein